MEILNLLEMQSASTDEGGIRVSYTGEADALLVSGALEDIGAGYDANIPFAPPAHPAPLMAKAAVSQGIVELGLMVGAADPYMHFPDGIVFTPYSVLRNVSRAPISVTPTLWWMQGTVPKSFPLPQFQLLPFETRTLDVPSMLSAAGLKDFSGYANLAFDTGGQTGLLMASGSVDQTYNYSFPVVPRGILPSASKSMSYWSTGNGDDTMVTMWNPADEAQNFTLRLVFSGGHYDRLITLEPRATYMFSISEIMATPGPDLDGNIIPPGLHEGSAELVGIEAENQSILVAVDSAVYNVRKATCYQQCTTCNGTTSYWVSTSPFGVAVNGQTQEYLQAQWNTGAQYDYTSSSSWSSSNTSVATVPQPGSVHGVAGGSFTVTAGISNVPVYANYCGPYPNCPIYGGGGGQAPGNAPQITSISPSTIPVGGSGTQVTITGSGFGSSPALNLPSGVTASNQQSADTQITVTLTAGYSSTIGNANISLSANGAPSNSKQIVLDGPYQLYVFNDTIGYYNGSSGNVSRKVSLQIQNFSQTNVTTSTTICEAPTKESPNCTPAIPDPDAAYCPGVSGHTADPFTTTNGAFIDQWSLASTAYSPPGCGYSTNDPWNWDPQGQTSTLHEMGLASGYIHTDAVQMDGVLSTIAQQNKLTGATLPR